MSEASTASERESGDGRPKDAKPGIFARISLFYRQVIAELRKVIWPTRKELLTYSYVVIVFVTVMALFVAALDLVFAKGVFALFGN